MVSSVIRYLKKLKYVFLLVVLVADFGIGTSKVLAIDETFYSLNNIIFYDPDSCQVGAGEADSDGLVGNDTIEKTLRYFVGKGLTLVQASGIVGNLGAESAMNPSIIEGKDDLADDNYVPVPGTGFGLAQWTTEARQQGLIDLSKSSNKPITDLGLQLDYIWQELSDNYKTTLDKLKTATEPVEAAVIFHDGYEVSADSKEQVIENRGGGASNVYVQYSAVIPDGTANTTSENLVCSGNGTASEYIDGFAIYDQYDPQWGSIWYGGPQDASDPRHGTIASAGCGPSAMAMIITALTKQTVTPADTAVYGRDHSPTTVYNETDGSAAGSLHNLDIIGDNWGLTATYVGVDIPKINEGLRNGGLVLVAGDGGYPFTLGGHFIVIRAVTADGMWLVGDSNGQIGSENSKKEWDPTYIAGELSDDSGYVVLFTK